MWYSKRRNQTDHGLEGRADRALCISCNRCLAALLMDIPIRCYVKGFCGEAVSLQ